MRRPGAAGAWTGVDVEEIVRTNGTESRFNNEFIWLTRQTCGACGLATSRPVHRERPDRGSARADNWLALMDAGARCFCVERAASPWLSRARNRREPRIGW